MTVAYALVQMVVLVGIIIQIFEDPCGPNAVFFYFVLGTFLLAGLLHPQVSVSFGHLRIFCCWNCLPNWADCFIQDARSGVAAKPYPLLNISLDIIWLWKLYAKPYPGSSLAVTFVAKSYSRYSVAGEVWLDCYTGTYANWKIAERSSNKTGPEVSNR